MSREIKFRAWDKSKQCMVIVLDMKFMFEEANAIHVTGASDIYGVEHQVFPEHLVLMQYTGLKDKEGREIYEGDKPDGIWGDSIIFWCNECCGFSIGHEEIEGNCMACDGDAHWSEFVLDVRDGKVTIIGNIHEHPSLLSPTS